jgi:hypothetical protein
MPHRATITYADGTSDCEEYRLFQIRNWLRKRHGSYEERQKNGMKAMPILPHLIEMAMVHPGEIRKIVIEENVF